MYYLREGERIRLKDIRITEHPNRNTKMNDNGIRQQTRHLSVQGLVEHLGNLTVSEEVELLEEVSQEQREETKNSNHRHTPTKSQTHKDQSHNLSVVALYLELRQLQFLLHLGLHFLLPSQTVRKLFHHAVEERHGKVRMKDKNQGIKDNLVADLHVPVAFKIRILNQTVNIGLEIAATHEVSNQTLKRNVEHIGLQLNKQRSTNRVTSTVVDT